MNRPNDRQPTHARWDYLVRSRRYRSRALRFYLALTTAFLALCAGLSWLSEWLWNNGN